MNILKVKPIIWMSLIKFDLMTKRVICLIENYPLNTQLILEIIFINSLTESFDFIIVKIILNTFILLLFFNLSLIQKRRKKKKEIWISIIVSPKKKFKKLWLFLGTKFFFSTLLFWNTENGSFKEPSFQSWNSFWFVSLSFLWKGIWSCYRSKGFWFSLHTRCYSTFDCQWR